MLGFLACDAPVDAHAAVQVLTLAALCPEESCFRAERVTEYLRTNAEVIRQLTGRGVTIEEDGPDAGLVCVEPL